MKTNSTSKQTGSVALDPRKMDTRDLVEGYYMLVAAATLLRQAFSIVAVTNSLLDEPLKDSDLKSFGNQFDIVHKTINTVAAGLKVYIDGRPKENSN